MIAAIAIATAILLDLLGCEPSNRWHPVAWMGNAIAWARRIAPRHGPRRRVLFGAGFSLLSSVVVALGVYFATCLLNMLPFWMNGVVQGVLLKVVFSARSLANAGKCVENALMEEDLGQARRELSYHLVSRDTSRLTEGKVSAATIESITENSSDSVVAPLFYFLIFGLPGAWVYRLANTADAMLGYRTEELEWLGKIPARWDDLLNWIPARITALLLIGTSFFHGGNLLSAIRIWWRDCWLTESPNAGHPMAAFAGAYQIRLEKEDCYVLGEEFREPNRFDIRQAIRSLWLVFGAWGFILLLIAIWNA